MQTLIIIGAGYEQIEAYKIAKAKGLYVVGTDINPNAPALKYADYAIIASTRDVEETLKAVCQFAAKRTIDGVMTIANDVPYTVSRVAEELCLPSAPSEAVLRLTDKCLMKRYFLEAQVASPKFWAVNSKDQLQKIINTNSYPYVLKPSDGRGARGVLYLDETVDLNWAYQHSIKFCDNKKLILEEFIVGPQLSVEGIFIESKYNAIAFADRNYSNLHLTKPYIIEDGGIIPSCFGKDILCKIERVIENGAKSLGLAWGTVKADIVLRDNEPLIIELAGRLSGNYLATHHIPYVYQVDIVGTLIDLSLGRKINKCQITPANEHSRYLGVRYFFPKPGVVKSIHGVEAVKIDKSLYSLDIFTQLGEQQPVIDQHGARAGVVMAKGNNYNDAIENVENLVKKINIETEPV